MTDTLDEASDQIEDLFPLLRIGRSEQAGSSSTDRTTGGAASRPPRPSASSGPPAPAPSRAGFAAPAFW